MVYECTKEHQEGGVQVLKSSLEDQLQGYEPVLKVCHKNNGTVQAENKYERSIKLLIFLSSAGYWLLKFVYKKIVADVFFS